MRKQYIYIYRYKKEQKMCNDSSIIFTQNVHISTFVFVLFLFFSGIALRFSVPTGAIPTAPLRVHGEKNKKSLCPVCLLRPRFSRQRVWCTTILPPTVGMTQAAELGSAGGRGAFMAQVGFWQKEKEKKKSQTAVMDSWWCQDGGFQKKKKIKWSDNVD